MSHFGRKSGPDAPRPVPFKKDLLPGITFVQACEGIGQYVIARTKRTDDPAVYAGIRSASQGEREATCERVVRDLASGKRTAPTGERPIGTTARDGSRYNAQETASAIVAALKFLDKENPAQAVRYRERIAGETDRALAQYRAGENPIGWSDGFLNEDSPSVKRASEEAIEHARTVRANRSGPVNSPAAKFNARGAAAQERERQEAARVERARVRAAKEASKEASKGGASSEGAEVKRPRRPGKKSA